MARNPWELLMICFLVATGARQRCEAGTADVNPVVVVRVEDPSGLAGPSLVRAQERATAVYQRAGVTLQWTLEGTTQPDRVLTIILTTSKAAPARLATDSMGVALIPGDGSVGTTAYIFMDKVTAFFESKGVLEHHVLACALAHEIGHLLLPPNAHRPDGIMRASWHPVDFPPRAAGILAFPPDQAKLLRLRARRP